MRIEEIEAPYSSLELFERLFSGKPHCFFLDSAMGHDKLGRFSFMGGEPFLILKSKGRVIEIIERDGIQRFIGNPFLVLRELLKKYSNNTYSGEIPFTGGAVGYFSYDLCHFIEKLTSTAIDDIDIPDCYLGFYDNIIAINHSTNKTYAIDLGISKNNQLPITNDQLITNGQERSEAKPPRRGLPITKTIATESNFSKEKYIAVIKKAKEYIKAGDIYQVNLSQRFSADLNISPFELYKTLRRINPAPFASYLNFEDAAVISASPERFLKVDARDRYIETRPIKGTRPRGAVPAEDERMAQELMNSSKDRAEHIMIVDLERNDLGRVCEYGSVKLDESMVLERYSTVFHLVSTISGALKEKADAVDCLLNCFPGGSITGAPKIRSMEIIDELEPTKRSVYTGAIGYIGFNGNMDTNIAIRTFIKKKDKVYFQVGGGIVADSEPEAEYQETLDKAKALMEAMGECGQLDRHGLSRAYCHAAGSFANFALNGRLSKR